jgi:hypothetical protein
VGVLVSYLVTCSSNGLATICKLPIRGAHVFCPDMLFPVA